MPKLRTPSACVEEIDYRTARDLDKIAGIPILATRGDRYWLAGRITVPQTGPFPKLLNEHDETSAAFDWKFGFEFRPVVHGADLLQLRRNCDVMQPAAPVLSADYVLCTRVHCVRGEHTRFAGRSGWQKRHIANRRSPIFH